ncbi:hypothetical protein [Streptomyces sp. NPDC002215]|uniref:hypothetical protein n=1 Tax=Streptomyces sp. NPDC002215 TaxID=3154412 RepID=UPI003325A12F
MARLWQDGTGERHTAALRAVQSRSEQRFREFSARGDGWDAVTRRATERLAQVWPGGRAPRWEEKFGDLCWKPCPLDSPDEAKTVIREAIADAAVTCQTCPSPGRKRVVWIWDSEYGWVMPWVKTVCDSCYFVPCKLLN